MCCVCTASFPRRDRAYPRRNVLCLHSIVSTTRPRLPAQKRTVSAQHRFHDETALTRAETYCVCTASFPRRDRAYPRRNVLCLHSIVSTTRPRLPAQKRTVSAQHRFHDETALTRAETYCVCSIFSTDETALACAETYCVCTASSQPTKPHSPAQSVLCLHSIFSTDETALACAERTVFAQYLIERREAYSSAEFLESYFVEMKSRSRVA